MSDKWLSVCVVDNKYDWPVTTAPGDPNYLSSSVDWLVHYADPIAGWRIVRVAPPTEDPTIGCQEVQAVWPGTPVHHAVIPATFQFPMTPGTHPIVPHHPCP